MRVGDLVWYYPAYGADRRLCIISQPHDFHGLLFVIYDFKRGFSFIVSKSCIKTFDKTSPIG